MVFSGWVAGANAKDVLQPLENNKTGFANIHKPGFVSRSVLSQRTSKKPKIYRINTVNKLLSNPFIIVIDETKILWLTGRVKKNRCLETGISPQKSVPVDCMAG
jgi:hypothetical protein